MFIVVFKDSVYRNVYKPWASDRRYVYSGLLYPPHPLKSFKLKY